MDNLAFDYAPVLETKLKPLGFSKVGTETCYSLNSLAEVFAQISVGAEDCLNVELGFFPGFQGARQIEIYARTNKKKSDVAWEQNPRQCYVQETDFMGRPKHRELRDLERKEISDTVRDMLGDQTFFNGYKHDFHLLDYVGYGPNTLQAVLSDLGEDNFHKLLALENDVKKDYVADIMLQYGSHQGYSVHIYGRPQLKKVMQFQPIFELMHQ